MIRIGRTHHARTIWADLQQIDDQSGLGTAALVEKQLQGLGLPSFTAERSSLLERLGQTYSLLDDVMTGGPEAVMAHQADQRPEVHHDLHPSVPVLQRSWF